MPPTRRAVVHPPARSAPKIAGCIYKIKPGRGPSRLGVGHIRPRDLAAKPKPPRIPTTPAERFTAALLDDQHLGLASLTGSEPLNNILVDISLEETEGEIEGWFQDPSTWALVLKLKPDMFMTPLRVVLEEFQGEPHAEYAPTWLLRLDNMPDKYDERVRSYKWVEKFVFDLLTTPYTRVPGVRVWSDLLAYIWRIKEVCEPRGGPGPRDPSRAPPRPRLVRSGNSLAGAMSSLNLESDGAGEISTRGRE